MNLVAPSNKCLLSDLACVHAFFSISTLYKMTLKTVIQKRLFRLVN